MKVASRSWLMHVLAWGLLAAVVWLAHGWTLHLGLTLDDHWHQRGLRELGWSVRDLLATTTIEPAQLMHHWWQDREVRFQYDRPLSVLLMKCVHVLSGGSVAAQHALSLILHAVAAGLVYHLAARLTGRRFWSAAAGALFAIYPLSVYSVGWLAAQNTILQTGLTLAAVLCYLRASGVPRLGELNNDSASLQRGMFVVVLLCWVAALLARENAIVLPAFLLALDASLGGRQQVRARIGAYLAMAAVGLAYLAWRFGPAYYPLPDVYLRRPDGWEYVPWLLAKLMHYLCCAVWPAPMLIGPTGRFNPWLEAPADCGLMAVLLLAAGAVYWRMARGVRGRWLWPLWITLAVLPVVPVLATPHTGYMCGVGFALGVVVGPAAVSSKRGSPLRHWRQVLAGGVLLIAAGFGFLYRALWKGMVVAERAAVLALSQYEPPAPGTKLFFINLPFVNVYLPTCLEETWGFGARALDYHVLAYAAVLERPGERCLVQQLGDYSFTVRSEGRRFFSGLLGRFLLEGLRSEGQLRPGEQVTTAEFVVRVDEVDSAGVRQLTFTFPRPLTDSGYRFYLSSEACAALRLRWQLSGVPPATCREVSAPQDRAGVRAALDRLNAGEAQAAAELFAAVAGPYPLLAATAADGFWPALREVAVACGYAAWPREADLFGSVEPILAQRDWWCAHVDDALLAEINWRREDFAALWAERHEIQRGRYWAAKFLHTDLFLTGRPFPGPR